MHRSPIEGYEVAGGQIIDGSGVSNKLEFNGSNTGRPYTHIIAVAVAGIVVGIIAGVLIGFLCFSSKDAEDIATASAENPTVESPAPRTVEKAAEPVAETVEIPTPKPKPSGVDAVKYLDENQVWRRAEMEEIPGLEGLLMTSIHTTSSSCRALGASASKVQKFRCGNASRSRCSNETRPSQGQTTTRYTKPTARQSTGCRIPTGLTPETTGTQK